MIIIINNNKNSFCPIRSASILVINKLDSHQEVVRFCHHSYYDNRPNWTPLSPIAITNLYQQSFILCGKGRTIRKSREGTDNSLKNSCKGNFSKNEFVQAVHHPSSTPSTWEKIPAANFNCEKKCMQSFSFF